VASDPAKLQQSYDALVAGFVLPLVEGTAGELGRPIAPGCFAFFKDTRPSSPDVDARVFDALHRAASALVPVETVPWPSPGVIAVAAAAYDLCALTDPSLEGLFTRGARATILGWTDRWLELVPGPTTRGDALVRHGLLAPLLAARRKDVVVKNWAYTYRFFGRPVPWNVTAFPTLRFVKTQEKMVGLRELLEQVDAKAQLGLRERLDALVARSPVTELSMLAELPRFRFGLASLAVLSDGAVRGAIARMLEGRNEWAAARRLGLAIHDPALWKQRALLDVALRLPIEMLITRALDTHDASGDLPEALDEGAMRYAALLPALLAHEAGLRELRILDDDDRALLQRRAERLRPVVTNERLAEAKALLDAAWGSD
jgi:hypothetical protein